MKKPIPGWPGTCHIMIPDLVDTNPSLYELAGKIDILLYRYDGTPLRQVLLDHKQPLTEKFHAIEEHIADRQLAEADKLLYTLEDIFDDIEYHLD
ncbi:MAG: hypothetical protein U5K27_09310 [Desulfotignum sp.]|nr:hypothetical protein [Desulfotignum sp.]